MRPKKKIVFGLVENIVGKGAKTDYQRLRGFYYTLFKTGSFSGSSKFVNVC